MELATMEQHNAHIPIRAQNQEGKGDYKLPPLTDDLQSKTQRREKTNSNAKKQTTMQQISKLVIKQTSEYTCNKSKGKK